VSVWGAARKSDFLLNEPQTDKLVSSVNINIEASKPERPETHGFYWFVRERQSKTRSAATDASGLVKEKYEDINERFAWIGRDVFN
jgi:hypothetical protein